MQANCETPFVATTREALFIYLSYALIVYANTSKACLIAQKRLIIGFLLGDPLMCFPIIDGHEHSQINPSPISKKYE